ncbi:hypothetical protein V8D89_005383 [Ganoderma adspersum]
MLAVLPGLRRSFIALALLSPAIWSAHSINTTVIMPRLSLCHVAHRLSRISTIKHALLVTRFKIISSRRIRRYPGSASLRR